jgi:hypothetical protein
MAEELSQEEKQAIEEIIKAMMSGYMSVLYKNSYEQRLSEHYYALVELNKVRAAEGLPPFSISAKEIDAKAFQAANLYRQILEERGGSFVVVVDEVTQTEKLAFKPWLKDLSADTKAQVFDIFSKSIMEDWSPVKLKAELSRVEELIINRRANAAAFLESRVQQHQAKMWTWKQGEVSKVQRHLTKSGNNCEVCIALDGRIYDIEEAPALSHYHCECTYSIYDFEEDNS